MARFLKRSVPVQSSGARWARLVGAMRRRWPWVAGVGFLVVGGLAWGLWPSGPSRYEPAARDRQFSSFTVCVLTGSRGIADARVAPVWAGVVDASKATSAQGSYLAVPAPDSEQLAETYVNTLAARHCSLVVAVGDSEVAAVVARAASYAAQHFVVVGSAAAAANVAVIHTGNPGAVQAALDVVVERAVAGRFTGKLMS